MISPQLEKHNREFAEEKHLTATILSDPGNQVAARYGLRFVLPEDLKNVYQQFGIDLPKYNGEDSWSLPLPARLIVDESGMVEYAAISADYTVRPDPQETIDALKNMSGG